MNIPTYLSGAIFARANRVLRATVYDCLEVYSLTPTAWSLLGIVIHSPDGVRLNEVATTLGVKAPLVTMLANDLLRQKRIRRIADRSDGRAKLLVITPAGKRFVEQVEAELNAQLVQLLAGTTKQDMLAYQKVLQTIIKNGVHKNTSSN